MPPRANSARELYCSHHRPDRARHGRRSPEMPRRRLQRLRQQTDRLAKVPGDGRAVDGQGIWPTAPRSRVTFRSPWQAQAEETLQSVFADKPVIARILPKFLGCLDARVQAMDTALAGGELEELRRLATPTQGSGRKLRLSVDIRGRPKSWNMPLATGCARPLRHRWQKSPRCAGLRCVAGRLDKIAIPHIPPPCNNRNHGRPSARTTP